MKTRKAFKCFLLHQAECQLLLFIIGLKGRENGEDKIPLSFSNGMSHYFQTSINRWVRGGEKRKLLGSLPPPEPQKAGNPRCWLDFPISSHTNIRHFDQKLGVTIKGVSFARSLNSPASILRWPMCTWNTEMSWMVPSEESTSKQERQTEKPITAVPPTRDLPCSGMQ